MHNRTFEEADQLLCGGTGGCPSSHTPIASLTIKLVGRRRVHAIAAKSDAKSNPWGNAFTAVACALIALVMVGVFTGAIMAMGFLGGQLSQRVQEIHQSAGQGARF
jgi:hypothetical protein